MITNRVAVRADASIEIGSGHVMRCLALAEELRRRGVDVVFIARQCPGDLNAYIEGRGFEVRRLSLMTVSGGKSTLTTAPRANWQSYDWSKDADETLEALQAEVIDWLIVDNYALDWRWESRFRGHVQGILVIDDLADRRHECDALLDQNLQSDMDTRYDSLVPDGCAMLLGPRYALLRPEFCRIRANTGPRSGVVRRILISFGGTDPTNETVKAIEAVRDAGVTAEEIDVVIGRNNPHREQVKALCGKQQGVTLHIQAENIAELMAQADLAIGAAGVSTWERCCLGLPAIVIVVADNQAGIAQEADQRGAISNLGKSDQVSTADISSELASLCVNHRSIAAMSESAMRLVDGKGLIRVACELRARMKISILCSSKSHPVFSFLESWKRKRIEDFDIELVEQGAALTGGDILFLISCNEIIGREIRDKYYATLVVHASDLPSGRGWSPLVWQILEKKSDFVVTLLEAENQLDSGPIWSQRKLFIAGHELYDEINHKLFEAELDLMSDAIDNFSTVVPRPQSKTQASYYRKRTPDDSRIDPTRPLVDQFDLLRIADPARYPAFFDLRGHRYIVQIRKVQE